MQRRSLSMVLTPQQAEKLYIDFARHLLPITDVQTVWLLRVELGLVHMIRLIYLREFCCYLVTKCVE